MRSFDSELVEVSPSNHISTTKFGVGYGRVFALISIPIYRHGEGEGEQKDFREEGRR